MITKFFVHVIIKLLMKPPNYHFIFYLIIFKAEPEECTGIVCPDPPKGGNSEKTGEKVICGVFLSTFGILGIVGNILSIIVFTRPSMKKSGNSIIFCGMHKFDHIIIREWT